MSLGNGFKGECDKCGKKTIVFGVANGKKYCGECHEEEVESEEDFLYFFPVPELAKIGGGKNEI